MAEPKRRTVYRAKYSGRIYPTAREAAIDNGNYLKAKKLSEQTKKIPISYIGGTPEQARAKFWKQEPVLQHAIDSVSKRYNVNPEVVKYRINHEGFVDHYIQDRNNALKRGNADWQPRGYEILNDLVSAGAGISDFGFDDYGTYLEEGKIKLTGKQLYKQPGGFKYMSPQYYTGYSNDGQEYTNEKGRKTNPATGWDNATNFGMAAAGLKYFKDEAKKDFPNASDEELDRYSLAYFNRGVVGGRKWVKSGAKGYNFKKRSLEDGRDKKSSGGSIHIAPSKKGTFTAAATKHGMSVQGFASKVLANKENYSPAMVKKANFAKNASKWNH